METLHNVGQKTISLQMVQKSIIEISPLNLSVQFLDFINLVLERYKDNKSKTVQERIPARAATQLSISPSLVGKYCGMHTIDDYKSKYEARMSKFAKIAIAAFLHEFLRLFLKQANGRNIINSRELLLAAYSDNNLKDFIQTNNIYILHAGITVYVSGLSNIKDRSDIQDSILGSKLKLVNFIIDLQEQHENVLQFQTSSDIVRRLFSLYDTNNQYRLNREAIRDLINFIEIRIVDLMRKSIDIWSLTSARISLSPIILLEMAKISGIRMDSNQLFDDLIYPSATIHRLAQRAGSMRSIKEKKEETLTRAVSQIIQSMMGNVIRVAIETMKIHGQTIFKPIHLMEATWSLGYILPSLKKRN
jgi:hypothetical protein